MQEHIENAAAFHRAMSSIHPSFGRITLIIMILGVITGAALQNNLGWIIAIVAGAINIGYKSWLWRHNYKISKKYPNKPIK